MFLSISFVIVSGLCCRLPVACPDAMSRGETISCVMPVSANGLNVVVFWPVSVTVPVVAFGSAGAALEAPSLPAGPAGPAGPVAPVAPTGPCGPTVFQLIPVSFFLHAVPASTTRTLPSPSATQASIVRASPAAHEYVASPTVMSATSVTPNRSFLLIRCPSLNGPAPPRVGGG